MAVVSGRDVLLRLRTDVAELKDNSRLATTQLEKIEVDVDELAGHVAELARIHRDSSKRFERVGKTLVKLAGLLGDHEARITALEARS